MIILLRTNKDTNPTGPVQRMTYIDNYFEIKWE